MQDPVIASGSFVFTKSTATISWSKIPERNRVPSFINAGKNRYTWFKTVYGSIDQHHCQTLLQVLLISLSFMRIVLLKDPTYIAHDEQYDSIRYEQGILSQNFFPLA